jgi:hypothetical protein
MLSAGNERNRSSMPRRLRAAWSMCALHTTFQFLPHASMFFPRFAGRTHMRLADYFSYAQQQADEEPLYVFDA